MGVIALVLLTGAIYLFVKEYGARSDQRLAGERLSLLSESLRSTIDRFIPVPELVGESRSISEILTSPADAVLKDRANRFLEKSAKDLGLAAVFILDNAGLAIAASNWSEPSSFVGNDYSFRPYFVDAVEAGQGRYFGVGVTTGLPGYFLSARINTHSGEKGAGIIVAKIDFSPLETIWSGGGDRVFVSDRTGVVFLTTDPALRYRPLSPLTQDMRKAIANEQRYANHVIGPEIKGTDLGSGTVISDAIPETSWRMTVVINGSGRSWQAPAVAALFVLLTSVLLLLLFARGQRRDRVAAERQAFVDLEKRVTERTLDLGQALARLEKEISERQRIDSELNRARDDLLQSAKLAAMGRAFSGLAHEVNQPLAALRTYLSSTRILIERNKTENALLNIAVMDGAVQRLATLTNDLKRLSRNEGDARSKVDLVELVKRTLSLLKFRFNDEGIKIDTHFHGQVMVFGNANRLEQVILNLLLNALDAVRNKDEHRKIAVRVSKTPRLASLVVADAGPGIGDADLLHIFEPFFTTKTAEGGLGLGLAISYAIVQQHAGTLQYERTPKGETRFVVTLPSCKVSLAEMVA